jgi:hypothetical protein
MKARFLSLLLASVCCLAPAASAQVSAGVYVSAGARGYTHGYSHGYTASRVWVPGWYETVSERVWVPGRTERIWVEPVYEYRPVYHVGACGPVRVLVRAGYWRTIHHPGHYELRRVRVYRPGYWTPRGCR